VIRDSCGALLSRSPVHYFLENVLFAIEFVDGDKGFFGINPDT
jgi:hypothetical protein